MSGKSVLIIPDAHACPEHDNERFTWLGKYVDDVRPDSIICLGDFSDLGSINASAAKHEGAVAVEGKRLQKDLDATHDALDKFANPFARRRYSPRMHMLHGNHEDFISRVTDRDPRLKEVITLDMLEYSSYGWTEVPFKETYVYAGWAFNHFFSSGDMGRPIGGVNVAASLVRKNHMSSVVGHNHRFDWHEETRPDGKPVIGVSAGCYVHPNDIGKWSRQTAKTWWRGVVLLHGARGGGYSSFEAVGMDALKERYS